MEAQSKQYTCITEVVLCHADMAVPSLSGPQSRHTLAICNLRVGASKPRSENRIVHNCKVGTITQKHNALGK